jgi:tetratricopeptide (TPR) repeat protein
MQFIMKLFSGRLFLILILLLFEIKYINSQTADLKFADELYNSALLKYNNNNYAGAIDDCNKAFSINPKLDGPLIIRASSKHFLGDYKGSINDFDLVLKKNPHDFLAYYIRGLSKFNLQMYNESIPDFNMAISLNSNNASFYYWRGQAELKLDDTNEALDDFNKTLTYDDKFLDVCISIAEIKFEQGKYSEAISDYSYLIKKHYPEIDLPYFKRGQVYEKIEAYDSSFMDYSMALMFKPHEKIYYFYSGRIKHKLKDIKGALSDFDQAISIDPRYENAYFNRAEIKYEIKDYKGAIKDYLILKGINPGKKIIYDKSGRAYWELKDYDNALNEWQQAIKIDSTDPLSFYYIARYYAKKNKPDTALDFLDAAFSKGFSNLKLLKGDLEFDILKNSEKYHQTLIKYTGSLP